MLPSLTTVANSAESSNISVFALVATKSEKGNAKLRIAKRYSVLVNELFIL